MQVNEQLNATLNQLRRNLDVLKQDLEKNTNFYSNVQRIENCENLLMILERQITEVLQ